MNEKPIIFSTPMVQAIQWGNKTQTRRVIKFPHNETDNDVPDRVIKRDDGKYCFYLPGAEAAIWKLTPPIQAWDVLWVRETWCDYEGYIHYKEAELSNDPQWLVGKSIKWRPAIHMPREAARIFLEVKGVRAERLRDISPDDAHDEGIEFRPFHSNYPNYRAWLIRDYRELWDSIHTKRRYDGDYVAKKRGHNWDANPWVWVYEFKKLKME